MLERLLRGSFPQQESPSRTALELGESEFWVPAETIRGHHFKNTNVQQALLGRENPLIMAQDMYSDFKEDRDEEPNYDGYFPDVIGTNDVDGERYIAAIADYFSRLQQLSDDSVIQIDEKPDGICRSCIVGRHCEAYDPYLDLNPTPTISDVSVVEELERTLKRGYRRNVDYTTRIQSKEEYDYDGANLKYPLNPEKVVFEYTALMIKTGVLRKILREQENEIALAALALEFGPF